MPKKHQSTWYKNGSRGAGTPPFEAIEIKGVLTWCPDARGQTSFSQAEFDSLFDTFLAWVEDYGLDFGGVFGGVGHVAAGV